MLQLKAKSNLRLNPQFDLPLKDRKSGFLGLYLNSSRLNPTLFTRLWATGRADSYLKNPGFCKTPAVRRLGSRALNLSIPSGLLKLRKESDHFIAWLPVVLGSEEQLRQILTSMIFVKKGKSQPEPIDIDDSDDEFSDDVEVPGLETPIDDLPNNQGGEPIDLTPQLLPGLQAISRLTLPAEVKSALSSCLQEIIISNVGHRMFVQFKVIISKSEAQYMSNLPWVQIRSIDLYSILQSWVMQYYGGATKKRPAKAAMPISEISKSLPTDPAQLIFKTNELGLSISNHGELQYIPRILNNTQRYEDAFIQAGMQPDSDDFQLASLEDPSASTKLPSNLPVLVDWVNSKFSYTNTMGMLTVRDLTRNIEANSTHINSWLSKSIDPPLLMNLLRLAGAADITPTLRFNPGEDFYIHDEDGTVTELDPYVTKTFSGYSDPAEYLRLVTNFLIRGGHTISIEYGHLASNSRFGLLRPLGRMFEVIYRSIEDRMETAYLKYSVQFVTANMGLLVLLAKYAPKWDSIAQQDRNLRSAAINQGVDPNWEPEALPLISDNIGRLPHQKKIANILRGSPNFAILPVQAGGGKSMLIITDILQELKRNQSAPYLLLCPRHLISNYVEEFTFFTKGRLNAIGITSYTLRRNGFDRLTDMIQRAPRNTVVITSMENLTLKAEQICYGTTTTTVFPMVEMLRRFNFQYVAVDESHYIKNESARTASVMSLISDIPKKRLASGTMSHDSPSDLAVQIAVMDPTLFGSRDDFNERFGEKVKGNRVIEWKPGAQKEIDRLIKSRVVVAGAQRKEWAALLPPTQEQFFRVNLTPEQYRVYNLILSSTVEEIQQNKALLQKMQEASDEETDAPGSEATAEELEALIKPYLQRLEQFVNAPAQDELGNIELRGEDRISPKAVMVNSRIRQHIEDDIPGKVMVFTNYTVTAEEIYATLDPEIQARTILYVAANKVEDLAKFKNDDRIIAMIGVEQSLNTGLNLQTLSRLIRLETVWNPGTLEQGNSRLNRPQLKTDEERAKIYYDWIVADNTIDITKVSRLMSKMVAVAKFENADTDAYQELPNLPIVQMNLESILHMNSWGAALADYEVGYRQYTEIQKREFAEYRAKFIAEHGTDFFTKIEQSDPAPDLEIATTVPYIQGMFLPNADDLGLIRLDVYISSLDSKLDMSDSDDDDASDNATDSDVSSISNHLLGMRVHTEFGDGIIHNVAMRVKRVLVRLDNGTQANGIAWSSAFVNPKDPEVIVGTREKVVESLDMPVAPEIESDSASVKVRRVTQKELREQERERKRQADEMQAKLQGEIYLTITNGFLSLVYYNDGNDVMEKALEALGFRPSIPFYYAHLPTAKSLKDQIELWNAKGFNPDPELVNEMDAIFELYHLLKGQKLRTGLATFKFANKNQLRNFYRMEHKPNADQKIIRPYPIIEDGEAYLALPIRGQVGTKRAIKVRAPRIIWELSEPSLAFYALQPQKVLTMLKKIADAGITIINERELNTQVRKAKRMKVRDSGELEL